MPRHPKTLLRSSTPVTAALSQHLTSHLNDTDLDYFRKWDRLIYLEKHANVGKRQDLEGDKWVSDVIFLSTDLLLVA